LKLRPVFPANERAAADRDPLTAAAFTRPAAKLELLKRAATLALR
jgi:hypothetical protein